jgi:hypothetical protein
LSQMDNTLVQRPIYTNKDDGIKRVHLKLTDMGAFNIVIRGLVKIPDRLTKDALVSVWSYKTPRFYTRDIYDDSNQLV